MIDRRNTQNMLDYYYYKMSTITQIKLCVDAAAALYYHDDPRLGFVFA